jgi:hypothetical protein
VRDRIEKKREIERESRIEERKKDRRERETVG